LRKEALRLRRWLRPLWSDRSGQGTYLLLIPLMLIILLLSLAWMAIHSVTVARATMSGYMQDALQQAGNSAGTILVKQPSGSANDWVKTVPVASASLQAAFTQDLKGVTQGTPFHKLPWTVSTFTLYTQSEVGAPAPWGFPGNTVSSPGVYAVVAFPWNLPLIGSVTVKAPEWMAANAFTGPDKGWNGGGGS